MEPIKDSLGSFLFRLGKRLLKKLLKKPSQPTLPTEILLAAILSILVVIALLATSPNGKPLVNQELLRDWTTRDESLSHKYPFFLLTPTYGIVTESDLERDKQTYKGTLFDDKRGAMGAYWQCFPTKMIKSGFESWPGPDGMGKTGILYPNLRIPHPNPPALSEWDFFCPARAQYCTVKRSFVSIE